MTETETETDFDWLNLASRLGDKGMFSDSTQLEYLLVMTGVIDCVCVMCVLCVCVCVCV